MFRKLSGLKPLALALGSLLYLSSAISINLGTGRDGTNRSIGFQEAVTRQANGPDGFLLRIMPLGASITAGVNSVPENGYRKALRDELRYLSFDVDMVGSVNIYGDMKDKEHEGHPSFVIDEVHDQIACSIKSLPNLVLINAGTNDCLQATKRAQDNGITITQWIDRGKGRMKSMIDDVIGNSTGVTVVLSTLIPNRNSAANGYANQINSLLRQLITEYQSAGGKVELAEMNNGFITVDDISTVDGTHPTNEGYTKMAAVWTQAIESVWNKGWITEAAEIENKTGTDGAYLPSPNGFSGPIQVQNGVGANDGETYTHRSESKGIFQEYHGLAESPLYKNFHFAQLVNDGGADPPGQADELIRVLDPDQREAGGHTLPAFSFQLNTGGGTFDDPEIVFDVGTDCLNRGVRWGDLNGDGLDDFLCINTEGKTWASINRGGNPPRFEYIGLIKDSLSWAPQERIRLGDIDGDGRLDWCAIDDNGDIFCWRNGGTGDAPIAKYDGYWQSIEKGAPTFNAKGQPGIQGVRFIDINGDGRSDWVYVYSDGSTRIFINHRTTHKGTSINGLKPEWIEAAVAHRGFPGETFDVDYIKFGRIYGTGRADYIRITNYTGNVGTDVYDYNFELYKNTGVGGRKLKGDGDHYCDMYGRGHDDYLWVWSTGGIELYENRNSPPSWTVHGEIFNTTRDRKSIHFGDWDGDGLCDILSVDRHTGNVDMWRNTYTQGSAYPSFSYKGQVVGGSRCTQGWGLGLYDLGLRFADIDGDGRVDYLCMEPDGRTTGYLNKANGLQNANQIKLSAGFDRANHQFADVNGDGRADFLWIDKFSGNVSVWINNGMIPAAGSSFKWTRAPGAWMKGVDTGPNMHFPKLSNSGRADFLQVTPKDNKAWVYYNQCSLGADGPGPDDGPITNPSLPIPPGGFPGLGGGGGNGGSTSTTSASLPTGTVDPWSVYLTGWEGCDDGSVANKRQFIKDSFDEFEKLIPEEYVAGDDNEPPRYRYPWLDWKSAPALEYFGSADKSLQYRAAITRNFDKLASVRVGFFTTWSVHVRCDDPEKACTKDYCDPCDPKCPPPDPNKPKKPFAVAYTMHGGGMNNHINFCPPFFNRPHLDAVIDNEMDYFQTADILDRYTNRAFTVGHELLHLDWVGKTIDYASNWLVDIQMPYRNVKAYAYRSQDAKWLAEFGTLTDAYNNVNNYMLYALAQYIIKRTGIYPSGQVWTSKYDPPPPPPVAAGGTVDLDDGTSASVYTETLECRDGLDVNTPG